MAPGPDGARWPRSIHFFSKFCPDGSGHFFRPNWQIYRHLLLPKWSFLGKNCLMVTIERIMANEAVVQPQAEFFLSQKLGK
jgi:hypothetical protein